MAISPGAREGVWIRRLLNELLPNKVVREMKILGDNETSLTLKRDPESQNRRKRIDMMYHHIHRLVEDRKILIE